MNTSLSMLIMLIGLAATQTVTISDPCTCTQMLTLDDCGRKSECQWDPIKKLCAILTTPTTPTPETEATSYCGQFTVAADCASANPCAWNEKACTHFTGCSVFILNSNDKCQEISTRCITDGVHCIEKDVCSAYKTKTACVINSSGKFCYWNTTDSVSPKCEDADDCPKYPASLNTDALCRTQLSKCTASSLGGCVESGIKCEEQKAEVACVTNKDKTQACFWTSGKCLDKTCDNAVSTLTTDQLCKEFLSSCTTKQGGGCVTRTTCGAATIQAACVKDNAGVDCFWNGKACVNKTCANALNTNKTNASCQNYLSTCITTGAGCVDNTGCDAAKIKDACDKTLSGTQCHWDGSACKVKTCTNAGSSYAGHDQCTTYMATCTANGATGCTDRSCTNAPTTNNTNDLCKSYHPTGNCVTKNGGGCRTNTTCDAIDLDSACVVDVSGRTCFWDGGCKTKTCVNSPASNNSHALCQAFLPTCTVSNGGVCVDKTCESIQAEADCLTDLNNKTCIYRGKCYQKQCAQASKTIITHEDCQAFLISCTLDNTGFGCMPLPLRCEAITQKNACVIKSNGGKCGLQGNSCVDQACTTTPADGTIMTTNDACNTYKTGCVVNNNLNGCMDLPSTCAGRQQEANCEYEQSKLSLTHKCEWDDQSTPASPVCIDIKCENAHLVSLKENVTQDGCWNYNNLNCIKVTSQTGSLSCAPRPKSCLGLGEDACQQDLVVVGDKSCYWDAGSQQCKDQLCSNITFANGELINHTACYTKINQLCTIDDLDVPTGCVGLKSCPSYKKAAQCVKNDKGDDCIWSNNICTDVSCANTDDSTSYDSDSKCEAFSKKCTVTKKKCAVKKATCEEYSNQNACLMHTIGGRQQCSWTSNACGIADFACGSVTGAGLTAGYCQNLSKTCSVNAAGTACIDVMNTCDAYTEEQCKWSKNEGHCVFSFSCIAISTTACYLIGKTSALECSSIKSQCTWTDGEACKANCAAATAPFNYNSCAEFEPGCTVKFDGSGCVNIGIQCSDITEANNCTKSQEGACYWANNICKNNQKATILTAGNCNTVSGGQNLVSSYCRELSAGFCSVNAAQTACIEHKAKCDGYTIADNCSFADEDGECAWSSANDSCKKKSLFTCSDFAGTSVSICKSQKSSCTWVSGNTCTVNCTEASAPFDYAICQAYDLSCTVKIDGSGCVSMQNDCNSTELTNCTGSLTEPLCYPSGDTCTPSTSALGMCESVTGANLTFNYCQEISNGACSVLADQSACVTVQNDCDLYTTLIQCFSSVYHDKCIISEDLCVVFDKEVDPCNIIKIYGLTTYTDYHCKMFKTSCQARADGSGCEDIGECSSFTGINLTYQQCMDKLTKCSVNLQKTACVAAKNTCLEYAPSECVYALNEGECEVTGTQCVQKSCDNAASNINSNDGCQAVSPNCILRTGGCQERVACSLYLIQGDCIKNNIGEDCLWNPITAICVDKLCSAAEATTTFDNHTKCQTVGNCTVKANTDKLSGQGCISLLACNLYVNQQQCQVSDKGATCFWVNNNPAKPFCSEKSCATADFSYVDHTACFNYFSGCTVDAVDIDGVLTPKGCIQLKVCNEYKIGAQCERSIEKDSTGEYKYCKWIADVCVDKSCATASNTENTHTLCAGYWSGCTVNATNDGCIPIPDKCEGMTQEQCFDGAVDSSNKKCYWVDATIGCVTRTCENSPNYESETECDTYLSGCTADTIKCQNKICEDYSFTTDSLCKAALSTCTSNGSICVTRGSCAQAQTEAGCVTDSSDRQCQWIKPATGAEYCTLKNCNTAPSSITTEEQCKQYFTPSTGSCTTKKDGGCTVKGACNAATVEAACKIDNNGVDCQWDTDKCRAKECKDFSGTSHAACNKIRSNCTVGLNGKCAQMANCEATTVRAACITGNNGPCLWINGYVNTDGSKGACFSYESCKSLDWTSDSQCKFISSNCTTNGTECVGITSCLETNITGGCKTGTDGQCIQTVSAKGANDTICKKYTSCDVAYYLTHEECYGANPNCTSDYTNGCVSLAACSAYTKAGQCQLNKDGAVVDKTGSITSTGICVWDETAGSCRDQQCKDIALTTEYECSVRLSTCSTDGTNCIVKGACNSYKTDNACNNAGGTEGVCFWVVATDTVAASCRTKICADIPNGTTTAACQGVKNCVSNGTNCIVKVACASYTTKTGCQSQGTDGLCAWTEPVAQATTGKCALMTGCASAKDETTCNQASNRCKWNSTTKVCAEHTCETYSAQIGKCLYYYTWDMKKYNICSIVSAKCVATDATTLAEGDCYTLTAYQYSWNPNSQKCSQCRTFISEINNSNLTNNVTTTDFQIILAWTSVILTYFVV